MNVPPTGPSATVDMQIINEEYARGPACGSRSRWVRLQIGEEDYIALATVGSG